jgi:hypothetical protein
MAPPEGKVGAALPQSSGVSLTYMLGPQSLGNCSHGVLVGRIIRLAPTALYDTKLEPAFT